MKIVHYIPQITDVKDPQCSQILRLITSVSRQTETLIITSSITDEVQDNLLRFSVKVVCLPELRADNPIQIYKSYKKIKNTLLNLQPDLVHVHGAWNPMLYLVERTARHNGFVTCVSTYGAMAPEILNIDFFKKKMLPLLLYQAPMIRHSASLLAINEKEWNDIRNMNLKKRVEILPDIPSTSEINETFSTALLSAYRKAIDSSYKLFLTFEEENVVRDCMIHATSCDTIASSDDESAQWTGVSYRRIFFHAYDEDVLELLHTGAKDIKKNMPPLINIETIPRYVDRKAKRRGSIMQLPTPKNRIKISDKYPEEYNAVLMLLKARNEGIKRLTLRHKLELYNMLRNTDFDEDIVMKELRRLHLKSFTYKIQSVINELYNMPQGYNIF